MSHAASLSPTLVAIPDVTCFWIIPYQNVCTKLMGKLINENIHMKYVACPICFKPHILLDKTKTKFLDLSVTPTIYGDIGLWILCTKSMGKFRGSYKLGALAFLWPNIGGGMQIDPCAVCFACMSAFSAYHLICQHDKLPLVSIVFAFSSKFTNSCVQWHCTWSCWTSGKGMKRQAPCKQIKVVMSATIIRALMH